MGLRGETVSLVVRAVGLHSDCIVITISVRRGETVSVVVSVVRLHCDYTVIT